MVYVEVFGGGGSVLLNKERSVREVLNDANGNLINLYRVVREHPDELKDRLLYVLHSREDFKIAQRRLAQFSYKDDILRAADFYQVVRQSYAGNGKQFSAVARSMWAGFPAIDRVAGRLQGVTLEKEDFGVIFQRYDSPTTSGTTTPPSSPGRNSRRSRRNWPGGRANGLLMPKAKPTKAGSPASTPFPNALCAAAAAALTAG